MKLTPEQRELWTRWIEALESGKYTQGVGALNSDGCFCCLGVLCDVIDPNEWTPTENTRMRFRGVCYSLPFEVRTLMRLKQQYENRLMGMNDVGKTFLEIAAYLRKLLAESEAA